MKLTLEQIEAIKKEANTYKNAVAKAGNAGVELWQARIDMSIGLGEAESLDDMIGPGRVAWGDTTNGNCPCPKSIGGMEEVERMR